MLAGRTDRQQVALVFEFATQLRLALGDVRAVDELASGRAEPTAIFHRKRLSDSQLPAEVPLRRIIATLVVTGRPVTVRLFGRANPVRGPGVLSGPPA